MKKTIYRKLYPYILISLFLAPFMVISGCASDYDPVYFPPQEEATEQTQEPDLAAIDCTISFTSQLCVIIKGDNIEAGTNPDEPLCVEMDPFPIHISGTEVTLIGSEIPDTEFEGHGLPAPITINGKGSGTGDSNIGSGSIDASGNIIIENFSFFIDVLGLIGEVPNLTFTTSSTDELPHLEPIEGSPPDPSGAMTLVSGTVLGHLIDAADEYLMGASLQIIFNGSITPTLDECSSSSGPTSIEIKKLFIDENGDQSEIPLPNKNQMEISSGTYIAQDDTDIGPKFEAKAKFKIKNISTSEIAIRIPSRIGPFIINSMDSLSGNLSSQQSIIIDVIFRPTIDNTEGQELIIIPLIIGTDPFKLIATANPKDGLATLSEITDTGEVEAPDIDDLEVGELSLPANTQKSFFKCNYITCNENELPTNCTLCRDETSEECSLLPVSKIGRPIGEVDANCDLIEPDPEPQMAIDLRTITDVAANKKIISIRNMGTINLTIEKIYIEEYPNSKSTGQFSIRKNNIYVANSVDEIRNQTPLNFPITLPPFEKNFDETQAFVVVTYLPTDLIGFDGSEAGIGSPATDKATLKIKTSSENISIELKGQTSIKDIPDLELYFKTSTGTQKIENENTFSFRDVTAETIDSAVPVFLNLSDTATNAIRIKSITIEDGDLNFYEWLDTSDKINSKSPPTGKGKRCSIPILDPSTGDMTNEIFDLNPVSLGARGFDIEQGEYSLDTMPLFGCVNFHRDTNSLNDEDKQKRLFKSKIIIRANELDINKNPAKNPDGSYKETELTANLIAAINPITGKMVLRITQTSATILNPQFPALSAISAKRENDLLGVSEENNQIFLGALILDPFNEQTIYGFGTGEPLTTPSDDITAVFRSVDTHPVDTNYDDPVLFDYAALTYDSTLTDGSKGIFEGFANVPDDLKANGWRIFTSTLSYPGPLAPEDKKFNESSACLTVNPCSEEGLKKFTDAGVKPGEKGACAFFYASGGRYESPAFHTTEEMEGGEYTHLCNAVNKKQNLRDLNTGHYNLEGSIIFEDFGLRFFGPTYFHNPGGPLGNVPPMDVIFHLGFTTDVLRPPAEDYQYNVLPDSNIDFSNNGYKINLDDPTPSPPAICKANSNNRTIGGKKYSAWKYLAPLLSKDPEGLIPAGCPEASSDLTGGLAYLHGRKLNHENGVVTFVAGANFGSSGNLTFAFKDVMIFIVLNGWVCNPEGREEDFEGARCYDKSFNERDALSQISIMDE